MKPTFPLIKYLTFKEYNELTEKSMAAGAYRNDPRVFKPGTVYECPWYHDPRGDLGTDAKARYPTRQDDTGGFLSVHYWNDWADKRPPLIVIGPSGETWEIDRKSSNGTGWVVTGEGLKITASPSIVLEHYHGFLHDGIFGADLENNDPVGYYNSYIARCNKERPLTTIV